MLEITSAIVKERLLADLPFKKINPFSYLLVTDGSDAIDWMVINKPGMINTENLEDYNKYIKPNPDYHFMIGSLIWKLASYWKSINYRCFLWCLHRDYNTTIQTLNELDSVFDPYSPVTEFHKFMSDDSLPMGHLHERPVLTERPTDVEITFLKKVFDTKQYPLALYQYIRPFLKEDENAEWFAKCEEKLIISYVLNAQFWVISDKLLTQFRERMFYFICLRFLHVAESTSFDLSSYYDLRIRLNKQADNDEEPSDFDNLSFEDKRNILIEVAKAYLESGTEPEAKMKEHLIYHAFKYASQGGQTGQCIALFRLYASHFKRVADFVHVFQGDPENALLLHFLIKRQPAIFLQIHKAKIFGLNWYLSLDEQDQITLSGTYRPMIIDQFIQVQRSNPEVTKRLIDSMSEEELIGMAKRYVSSALTQLWPLPNSFWLDNIKVYGHNILTVGKQIDKEILWEAAIIYPDEALQYSRTSFSAEQVQQLIDIRDKKLSESES